MENFVLSCFGLSEEYLQHGHVFDSIQILKGLHNDLSKEVRPNLSLLEQLTKLELRLSQIYFKYTTRIQDAKDHMDYCLNYYKKLKKARKESNFVHEKQDQQHICLQIYNLYSRICFNIGAQNKKQIEDIQKHLKKALKYCDRYPNDLQFEKEYFIVQTCKMYFYQCWVYSTEQVTEKVLVEQHSILQECINLLEESIQRHCKQNTIQHVIWRAFYLCILAQIQLSFLSTQEFTHSFSDLRARFEELPWKEESNNAGLEHQTMCTIRSMFYILLSIYFIQVQEFQELKKSLHQVQKAMKDVHIVFSRNNYQCIFDWISIPSLFSLCYLLTSLLHRSTGDSDKAIDFLERTTKQLSKRTDEIKKIIDQAGVQQKQIPILDHDTSEEYSTLLRLCYFADQEKAIIRLCTGEILYVANNLVTMISSLKNNTAVFKEFFFNIHLLAGIYFVATNELEFARRHFSVVMNKCLDVQKKRWAKAQLLLLELLVLLQSSDSGTLNSKQLKKKVGEVFALLDETNNLLEQQPKEGGIKPKAIQAIMSYVRGMLCQLNLAYEDSNRHLKDALTLANAKDGPVSNCQLVQSCMLELSKISFRTSHNSTTHEDHAAAAFSSAKPNDPITYLPLYKLLLEYAKGSQEDHIKEARYMSMRNSFAEKLKQATSSEEHERLKKWLPGDKSYEYAVTNL